MLRSIVYQDQYVHQLYKQQLVFLSDVASSGATDLMIKSGTTSLMSLSLSTGIKYYTYTAFSNTAITNIGYTTFVAKVLRCTGIIQESRRSFMYMQVSGITYLRTQTPLAQ